MAKPRRPRETFPGDRAYWQALGRFIDEFSHVEAEIYLLLMRCLGLSRDAAAAVFSGVHVETAMGHIRRLLQVSAPNPERNEDLLAALTQLTHINNFRNSVVHLGATVHAGRDRFTTNHLKALTVEKQRFHIASPKVMDAMTHDLKKIGWHLYLYADAHRVAFAQSDAPAKAFLSASWRYTPPAKHGAEVVWDHPRKPPRRSPQRSSQK